MTNISMVIPAFNEAPNIARLLEEILAVLQADAAYEVIVVDDGSTDNTVAAIRTYADESGGNIRLVQHSNNCGQSAAILSGVRAASNEWIVTLDGDGQNDPADIPLLLEKLSSQPPEYLLIAGYRIKRNDNWLRRISSRVANRVRDALLHDHCPDSGCGLKAFRRDDFLKLPHFNHMHRFLPALFIRDGGRVVNVPVHHRPRLRGESKYGLRNRLWAGIVDLLGVMWLIRRSCHPGVKS